MHTQKTLHGLLLAQLLGAACRPPGQDAPTLRLSRTVRIPVQYVESAPRGRPLEHPEMLTLSAGGEDELPQGPTSFDVAEDERIVVSDPLRRRLVFYDSRGVYLEEWRVGFAATSVTFLPFGDSVEALSAATDQRYVAARGAQPRRVPATRGEATPPPYTATLDRAQNEGRLSLSGARGEAAEIAITLATKDSALVSLEYLGLDRRGNAFVALETAGGGDRIDVGKHVRIYSADGRLVGKITDVTLQYFVYPEDGFRIRGGKLYQLVPQQDAVLINIWDAT